MRRELLLTKHIPVSRYKYIPKKKTKKKRKTKKASVPSKNQSPFMSILYCNDCPPAIRPCYAWGCTDSRTSWTFLCCTWIINSEPALVSQRSFIGLPAQTMKKIQVVLQLICKESGKGQNVAHLMYIQMEWTTGMNNIFGFLITALPKCYL